MHLRPNRDDLGCLLKKKPKSSRWTCRRRSGFQRRNRDALDARPDDLDNEIGQMEGRLGAEVDETLETVTDADLSDDLTEVSSELLI